MYIAIIQDLFQIRREDGMAVQMDDYIVLIPAAQQVPDRLGFHICQALAFRVVPSLGGNARYNDQVAVFSGREGAGNIETAGKALYNI